MIRAVGRRYGLASGHLDELLQNIRIPLCQSRGPADASEPIESIGTSYLYRTAVTASRAHRHRRRARRPRREFDRRITWRSIGANTRYTVTLLRDGLPLVQYGDLEDTVLSIAASVRLDPPARYHWYVEATIDGGRVRSSVTTFSLR